MLKMKLEGRKPLIDSCQVFVLCLFMINPSIQEINSASNKDNSVELITLKCIYYPQLGDVDLLECSWTPCFQEQRNQTRISNNQTLFVTKYRESSDVVNHSCSEVKPSRTVICNDYTDMCAADNIMSCRVKLNKSSYKILHIVLENQYDTETSSYCDDTVIISTENKITKYSKVSDLKVAAYGTKLSWVRPNTVRSGALLKFNVTLASKFGSRIEKSYYSSKQNIRFEVTKSDLKPYTEYNISVVCALVDITTNRAIGYWSDPTFSVVLTDQSVPGANPEISPGSFKVSVDPVAVTLYWKRVPRRDRHGIFTEISVCVLMMNCEHCKWRCLPFAVVGDKEPFVVTLSDDVIELNKSYEITVESVTKKGKNRSLKPQHIFVRSGSKKLQAPKKLAVRSDGHDLNISWLPVSKATTYTVYWCKLLSTPQCKSSEMNWQVLPANRTELEVAVGEDKEFAVSAEREELINGVLQNTSSGLVFATCVYNSHSNISRPKFKYAAEIYQNPESLAVEWERAACESTDYIDEYVIEYWKEGTPDKHNKKRVSAEGKTIFVIPNLEALVAYNVTVYGVNRWNKQSEQLNLGTMTVTSSGLSIGWKAAIVVIAIVFSIAVLIVLVFCVRKGRKYQEPMDIKIPSLEKSNLMEAEKNRAERDYNGAVQVNQQNEEMIELKPMMSKQNRYLIVTGGSSDEELPVENISTNGTVLQSSTLTSGTALDNGSSSTSSQSARQLSTASNLNINTKRDDPISSYTKFSNVAGINGDHGDKQDCHGNNDVKSQPPSGYVILP